MSNYDDMDLAEQVVRLSARVAELEERIARLETAPSARVRPVAVAGETDTPNPVGGEEMVAGIQAILRRLWEAEAGQIRHELVKSGFPASLTRSDINKTLYRNTALFGKNEGEAGKPLWRLI
jgi:hypothetical protein